MFSRTEFTRRADEALALAHQFAEQSDPRYDGYYSKDTRPGCVYHFFNMSISPSEDGGVGFIVTILGLEDCSCCPTPIFAIGRGETMGEAFDALVQDICPTQTVGDEWKPTLGDLAQL